MEFLDKKAYTGRNQWYWYILSLLFIYIATQLGLLPLIGYTIWQNINAADAIELSNMVTTDVGLVLTLFSYVVGLFSIFLCVKYIHKKKPVNIITGRNKVDWKRILFGAGIWSILSIIGIFISLALSDNSNVVFQFHPAQFFILLITVLILLPFQTSFEELIFRGYLMQWAMILFKNKWIAIILTSLAFGFMHSINPEVQEYGILSVIPQHVYMGLLLGYIAVQDNGMELALGIHASNNILAAITFTSDSSSLQTHALFHDLAPCASWIDSILILIIGIIFIWISNRRYHFVGNRF